MNKVILIGGAPTAGKSFIARMLSEKLKLPWISSDSIREAMRKIVSKEDFPKLMQLADDSITAEEYFKTHTPHQVVESEKTECIEVWNGVKAFIDTDYVWKKFIVEGVAVLPSLVNKIDKKNTHIKPIFLVDENEDRIRNTIYTRGLWGEAHTYSDHVKEIEVEWVMLFNKYILEEAEKYGYKTHRIDNREKLQADLVKEIGEWI